MLNNFYFSLLILSNKHCTNSGYGCSYRCSWVANQWVDVVQQDVCAFQPFLPEVTALELGNK